ncbi:aldehyde dehydrogenase family protein, partial [Vibrio parahaemolyticus V-223/04]
VSTIRNSRYW